MEVGASRKNFQSSQKKLEIQEESKDIEENSSDKESNGQNHVKEESQVECYSGYKQNSPQNSLINQVASQQFQNSEEKQDEKYPYEKFPNFYGFQGYEEEQKSSDYEEVNEDGGDEMKGIYTDPYNEQNGNSRCQVEDENQSRQNNSHIHIPKNNRVFQHRLNYEAEENYVDEDNDLTKSYFSQNYSDNSFFLQKNTDGRHMSQKQRRNFARMLMEKTKGMDKQLANQIISRQSNRIKVFSNEVAIWMSIYKIVFEIQFQKSRHRMTEEEVTYEIESRLVDYLNQNPYEKKYKFIKISNRTFRSLKIKKCTGDYWLSGVFKRFAKKLSPHVDQASLLKKLNDKILNQPPCNQLYSGQFPYQNEFFNNIEPNFTKKEHIMLRCQNNYSHQNSERYPAHYREKLIQSIDQIIQRFITDLFYRKHNEHHINMSSLISWYTKYGKLDLFNEGSYIFQNQMTLQQPRMKPIPSSNPIYDNPYQNLIKVAQKEILNYIKINTINDKQKIQTFALSTIYKLEIQELYNEKIFKNWLDKLILQNCTDKNGSICLKVPNILLNSGLYNRVPAYKMPK